VIYFGYGRKHSVLQAKLGPAGLEGSIKERPASVG
jgi:hypothetical protein